MVELIAGLIIGSVSVAVIVYSCFFIAMYSAISNRH